MSDAITATVFNEEWGSALRGYEKEFINETLPHILNKKGLRVAIIASGETPKATVGDITKAMKSTAPGMSPNGKAYGPWLFVLTNARRKARGLPAIGGKIMSQPASEFLNQRRSSVAYIKAGWTPAIIKFGGHSKAHISKASKILRSQNKLARGGDLEAILENTAAGAGKVGFEALQKAVSKTTQEMLIRVEEHQSLARKYSAK